MRTAILFTLALLALFSVSALYVVQLHPSDVVHVQCTSYLSITRQNDFAALLECATYTPTPEVNDAK